MLMQKTASFERNTIVGEAVSLSEMFQYSPTETIAAGKTICWEGDAANHLFQVVEGVVRLQRIIGEGRRVITAFLFPGDLIGAALQATYLFTAEAVNECKIRRMSCKTFHEEVSRSENLRPEYIALLSQEMASAHEQMVLLSKKNAEERLCSFVVRLSERPHLAKDDMLSVPMNRQDIADYLGLTIETVSRTISKLASRKILTPVGRHDLKVASYERLSRLSGNTDDIFDKTCDRVSLH
ncbi:Crp/Fnr family transcriptional regulator [Rhizobium mesoamericanum]|uniref:Crp/Fnr family transcriptional regulator n=1 Tax=Rhizobium mesoamericanum TaxID=1079800 RepID=UPI000416EDFD|nr:helix-turn-helix domain-containing protein [Rhizobium mesoamericanum]